VYWQGQEFPLLHLAQTGSGGHPTTYTKGTEGRANGGGGVEAAY
jgi:hypothetical protein